jgi:hypothetical protein
MKCRVRQFFPPYASSDRIYRDEFRFPARQSAPKLLKSDHHQSTVVWRRPCARERGDAAHDPLAQFLRRCSRRLRNHFLEAILSEFLLARVGRLVHAIRV